MIFKNIFYNIQRRQYLKHKKDINDKYLDVINDTSFRLYGFSKDCIRELHNQYCLRYGRFPITIESIREVFDK